MCYLLIADEPQLSLIILAGSENTSLKFDQVISHYEIGRGTYGNYVHGCDTETGETFLVHQRFHSDRYYRKESGEVHFCIVNEDGDAMSEKFITLISERLGVLPVVVQEVTKEYSWYFNIAWARKFWLYVWNVKSQDC